MALTAIKVQGIRQSVADSLRRAVLEGQFPPGSNLSEVAIAKELQVSRGSVREALLVLAQDGLVNHSPNRGFYTVRLTEHDIAQIQQVRLRLETYALSEAQPRVTPKALEGLTDLRDRMVAALESGDRVACLDLELTFHTALWEAAENPWLSASLRRVMVPYFAFAVAFELPYSSVSIDLHYEQHDVLIRFLRGETDWSAERCVWFHVFPVRPYDR